MKEVRYYVKSGSDNIKRFYIEEIEAKTLSTRQAKRVDIKMALRDIRQKRIAYDGALMEFIKDE